MRKLSLFVFFVLLGFSGDLNAAGGGNILRGGLGFLFPDRNSFANPGQFADNHAMAVEAFYKRTTDATPIQTLTPSFVYGNGTMGLGVYGTRAGAMLTGAGYADVIGGGLGFSLVKGRATVGVGYDKNLSSTDSGTVSGTLTLNPPNRQGVSIGVGYRRDITAATHSLNAGLGYSFMSNSNVEVDVQFPSLSDFSAWNLSAYMTMMKSMVYFGAGYTMAKAATTDHGVTGRLGFVLGRSVDISFWANYLFTAGAATNYGGSFRASF